MKNNKRIILIATVIVLLITLIGCINIPEPTNVRVDFTTPKGMVNPGYVITNQGEKIDQPSVSEIDGYEFVGWYTEADFLNQWCFVENAVYDSKTLFARWQPIEISPESFIIAFETGLGSDKEPLVMVEGEQIKELKAPTKVGYDFVQWTLNGEKVILPLLVESDKTLVAVWTAVITHFTVTLVFNNGFANQVFEVAIGDLLERPSEPTNFGFEFIGWFEVYALYDFDFESTAIIESITLYARWWPLEGYEQPFLVTEWPTLDPNISFDQTRPVQINFWHHKSAVHEALLIRQIDDFHRQFPNITVNLHREGGNASNFVSALLNEIMFQSPFSMPDVIVAPAGVAVELAMPSWPRSLGVAMPLNNLITHPNYGFTPEQWLDFFPAFRRQVQIDNSAPYGHQLHNEEFDISGTIMGLPYRRNTDVMIYNRTLLAEFGLTSMPTTWEGMLLLGALMDLLQGDMAPLTTGWEDCRNMFATLAHQNGMPLFVEQTNHLQTVSDLINFDNVETIEMLAFFNLMFQANMLITRSMVSMISPRFVSDIFEVGDMLSFITPSNTVEVTARRSHDMVLGVAPIPQITNTEMVSVARGADLSLLYNACQQRMIAAWKLMQFLTSSDVQAEFVTADDHPVGQPPQGFTPTRASVLETDIFATYKASIPFAGIHQSDLTYEQLLSLTQAQRARRLVFDALMVTIEIIDNLVCAIPPTITHSHQNEVMINVVDRFNQALLIENDTLEEIFLGISNQLIFLRSAIFSFFGSPIA